MDAAVTSPFPHREFGLANLIRKLVCAVPFADRFLITQYLLDSVQPLHNRVVQKSK
jgi:hypothetical protein